MQNGWYRAWGKRSFDVVVSAWALWQFWPLLLLIAILVKIDSKGPAVFSQERVGENFRPFQLYKFRSMVSDAPSLGLGITAKGDSRVTRVGRILRATKLDELPQLWNVLIGDMSFMGPRPELAKYVEAKKEDYKKVLSVKPGITDEATIQFRDEEAILANFEDKEKAYIEEIMPKKIELYHLYVDSMSLDGDLGIAFRSILAIFK